MSIKVNDSKDPVAEQDSLLVQVDYANQPIPNNRLPKGLYYSFKDKWVDMITLLTPAIKKIITANTTVPAWGSITGTLSNQTDLQSALDNKMSSDLTDSHIFVGDATNKATDVAMTGDVTIDNTGATTLANTAVTAGTYGNSTNVPQIIVDAKGRITGASNVAISGASVTPSALTKTDDTNVTLTLGGTPSTALLQAVSLTLGWAGTLADSRIASASTWNNKQNALGYTPEDVANKATSLTSPDNTKYPTTQAVQTGLDLKANKSEVVVLVNKISTTYTVTGTTSETSFTSLMIPANTFSSGDRVILDAMFLKTGGAGTTVSSFRISTSSSVSPITNATLMAKTPAAIGATTIYPLIRNYIKIDSPTSTIMPPASSGTYNDFSSFNSLPITNLNIDWTVDQYIYPTETLGNSADAVTLKYFAIYKG